MPEFLVELYVSQTDAVAVERGAARARHAARELSRGATSIRDLRSIFVPEDETCFLLCEAASAEAVREVAARAGLAYERVAEAFTESHEDGDDEGRSALSSCRAQIGK